MLVDESVPLSGGAKALDGIRRVEGLTPVPAVMLTVSARAEGLARAQPPRVSRRVW